MVANATVVANAAMALPSWTAPPRFEDGTESMRALQQMVGGSHELGVQQFGFPEKQVRLVLTESRIKYHPMHHTDPSFTLKALDNVGDDIFANFYQGPPMVLRIAKDRLRAQGCSLATTADGYGLVFMLPNIGMWNGDIGYGTQLCAKFYEVQHGDST